MAKDAKSHELGALKLQPMARWRSTNWYPNGKVPRTTEPSMFGEGLGNHLGLDGPRYTLDAKRQEKLEHDAEELQREEREKDRQKKRKVSDARAYLRDVAEEVVQNGGTLVGERIFMMEWHRKDWERRGSTYGFPEGVSMAIGKFGAVIVVPVIEEAEKKALGRSANVPEWKQGRDEFGRKFWVTAEMKNAILNVYGLPVWKRPLSIREAEQFGISIEA
jgi:hypothetical protein